MESLRYYPHAYAFFELLKGFITPESPESVSVPSCVLDAFHIERVLVTSSEASGVPVVSAAASHQSDVPRPGSVPSTASSEMSTHEVALVDSHSYDDLPVRYIQISCDFTGTPILLSDDSLELRPIVGDRFFRKPRTPIFGTSGSLWCALYLRRTEGGPRAQVIGTQVDPDRNGFDYLEAGYFNADGNMFQGEDIGEDTLLMRSVPPPVYQRSSGEGEDTEMD
jgi:hypothetical protein